MPRFFLHALLKKLKTLKAKMNVTVVDNAGNTTTRVLNVKIVTPKKPKPKH